MNRPPRETPPSEPVVRDASAHLETPKKWRRLFAKIARLLLMIIIGCSACAAGLVAAGYIYFTHNLPSIEKLKTYSAPTVTQVYADNGELIGEFANQLRFVVPMDQIPQTLKNAFISAEDKNFLKPGNVDWWIALSRYCRATIAQQVTRTFLLTPEKRFSRKIKEAIFWKRIERCLGKDYILFLYLNEIYLGSHAYGVEAAARTYFDKGVKDLTIAECAMIAGLPKAPSAYSPKKNLKGALERRAYVLKRMLEDGYISHSEYEQAMKEKPRIATRKSGVTRTAPDFVEHVRRYLEKKYGADMLFKEGLQVYTTVDLNLTAAALIAMDRGLQELDKRQGYRGPLKTVDAKGMKEFLREKSQTVDNGFKAGEIVEGVVTKIDNENVYVGMRDTVEDEARKGVFGQITIDPDPNWWVRTPFIHPEMRKRNFAAGDLPFQVGDVILVRIIAPDVQLREIYARKYGNADKETTKYAADMVPYLRLEPEQTPVVQSALMLRENKTGYVRAMLGGFGSGNGYNRATQARRFAGTSFHPAIYAAALSKGFTPEDLILDAPLSVTTETSEVLRPKNYGCGYAGPVTFRNCLVKSRDVPTIRILREIGVSYARSYARRLGYTSPLVDNLTLALGSTAVSLEEQLNAFAVYPNSGYYIPPIYVKKIVDRHGKVLEEHHAPVLPDDSDRSNRPVANTKSSEGDLSFRPSTNEVPDSPSDARRGIDAATASAMTSMLQGVVQEGTATVLKGIVGRPDIAGKTGTNHDHTDAWFVGCSPDYTCGVWVGFDEEKSIGHTETGGSAAAPMWGYFMREVLKGTPIKEFPPPNSNKYSSDTSSTSTK